MILNVLQYDMMSTFSYTIPWYDYHDINISFTPCNAMMGCQYFDTLWYAKIRDENSMIYFHEVS